MEFPDDRKYTETHEWAKQHGNLVRVGITRFAVEQLGDVIFLDLPDPSTHVTQGAAFGEIESVKAVSDLISPLSGDIIEVNEKLLDDYDAIADDPYEAAWMIAVAPADPGEMDKLLSAAAYAELCQEEA